MEFIKVGRPTNAVMVFIATLIGGILSGAPLRNLILAPLSSSLISMGAQAINDFVDWKIDVKRGKTRVKEKETALKASEIFFTTGLFVAFMLSSEHVAVAFFAALLSILYALFVQRWKVIGNIVVSSLVALSFIYGALPNVTPEVVMLSVISFFANWAREIAKDIEDEKMDLGYKVSLVHILGKYPALLISKTLLLISTLLLLIYVYISVIHNNIGYLLLLPAVVYLIPSIKDDESRLQRRIKHAMIYVLAVVMGLKLWTLWKY